VNPEAAGFPQFRFLTELKRRNVFRVAATYLGAAWLVVHVGTVLGETFEGLHRSMPLLIGILAAGLPIVLVATWFVERRPAALSLTLTARRLDLFIIIVLAIAIVAMLVDRLVLHRPADESLVPVLALIIVVMLADRMIGRRATEPTSAAGATGRTARTEPAEGALPASVVVLPFANLTRDPEKEYFGDGMAEELISVLARVPGLKVPARTSSFAYKGKNVDVRQIARELGVETVLEGSVRSAGERIRVVAQLVNARTGFHVWSHSWDRDFGDLFKVQDELAAAIAKALGLSTHDTLAQALINAPPTQDLEAYQLYLQGLSLRSRIGEQNLRRAVELFEKAVDRDPKFARARAAAVIARILRGNWSLTPRTADEAESDARLALSLDPHLAEAHFILGDVSGKRGRWLDADRHFRAAVGAEGCDPVLRAWYALQQLTATGHTQKGLEVMGEAYRQAPENPMVLAQKSILHLVLAQDEEAVRCARLATDLGFSERLVLAVTEAYAALHARRYEEAAQRLSVFLSLGQQTNLDPRILRTAYEAIDDTGQRPAALAGLRELSARLRSAKIDLHREIHVLMCYSLLGALNDAYEHAGDILDRFEKFGEIGVPGVWGHLWSPEMRAFRRDARFQTFATRLGLMDYWKQHGPPDGFDLHGNTLTCR
jgi:TolB-like protein